MNLHLKSLLMALGLMVLSPMVANARPFHIFPILHQPEASVPELDASSMSAALTLLAGGIVVLASRRRKS
jgi:hypothetical protein